MEWLPVLVALIPIAGVAGGLLGARWARKSAVEANDNARRASVEADNRGRRQDVLAQMRWASELAVSDNPRQAELGVAQLAALLKSDLLTEAERSFIDASLEVSIRPLQSAIESAQAAGEAIELRPLELGEGLGQAEQDDDDDEDDDGQEVAR